MVVKVGKNWRKLIKLVYKQAGSGKIWWKVVKVGKNAFHAHQHYKKWGYEHIWAQQIHLKIMKFICF